MEVAVFIAGAFICLLGAFGLVTRENPVHAALSLVGTLFGIAVLFIAQDAEFLAAVQVIVYAGAIVVMFLFVIMLIGVDTEDDLSSEPLVGQRTAAVIGGVLLAAGLIAVFIVGDITGEPGGTPRDPSQSNVVEVGRVLFTEHLWAFEITTLLLVIAVVGAVVLARHRPSRPIDEDLPGDELPESDQTGPDETDVDQGVAP